MTAAAAFIDADEAVDDVRYDLYIGEDFPYGNDSQYQRITSSKLRDVYNNGVNKDISGDVFKNSGLEHFYWGDMSNHSTVTLGSMCFSGCTNMTEFELPSPSEVATISISSSVFTSTGLTYLKLESNVKSINNGSQFGGCTNLKTVDCDAYCIQSSMFTGSVVETVNIGPHVQYIYSSAFAGVSTLKSIEIPSTVDYVYNQAFIGCTGLKTISVSAKRIGTGAFNSCIAVETLTFGSGLETLDATPFSGVPVTTLDIPSTVTSISYNSFSGMSNLTVINVHKEAGSIDDAPWGASGATVNWGVA